MKNGAGIAAQVEREEIRSRRGLRTVCEQGHEDAPYEIELRAVRMLQVQNGRLEHVREVVFGPNGNERRSCVYEIHHDDPTSGIGWSECCGATVKVFLP